MKKNFIKLAALSLAAVLSVGMITACGNVTEPGENEKTETTDTAEKSNAGGDKTAKDASAENARENDGR